ncbi:MAG: serine/threonine-protein kinase [Acidobacteriota bacterium]
MQIGDTIERYRVLAKLGEGGMGVVYRAEDRKLHRSVAIKLLPHDLTGDEDAKRRFMVEAQAASALDHPNICTIYEIDEAPDGQLFLVMAYYEGETLATKIARGPLALDEALDYAVEMAQGLVKAHSAGIGFASDTHVGDALHLTARSPENRDTRKCCGLWGSNHPG